MTQVDVVPDAPWLRILSDEIQINDKVFEKTLIQTIKITEQFEDTNNQFEGIQLQKIYRQSDERFIGILNNIRLGFYSERDFAPRCRM